MNEYNTQRQSIRAEGGKRSGIIIIILGKSREERIAALPPPYIVLRSGACLERFMLLGNLFLLVTVKKVLYVLMLLLLLALLLVSAISHFFSFHFYMSALLAHSFSLKSEHFFLGCRLSLTPSSVRNQSRFLSERRHFRHFSCAV
jgi:hypothetical protein